jgi:hypothetical protein
MSGRRRHPRYVMWNVEGTLRMVTDVMVQQDTRGNLIALSDQPRSCGEKLIIELTSGDLVRIPVRVAGSCPIVEDGSIRHLLTLVRLEQDDRSSVTAGNCR